MLSHTFFFDPADPIPVPDDFARNIVRYKGYDLTSDTGRKLWHEVQLRLRDNAVRQRPETGPEPSLYSDPVLGRRRLGQGSFRALVADTYRWRCAVTGERAHPVLEAAHIVPVSEGGRHELGNGILLRSDIHRLFDGGYVSMTPDYRFLVSNRLKEEFDNGEPYYPLRGRTVWTPGTEEERPVKDYLEWHRDTLFRG